MIRERKSPNHSTKGTSCLAETRSERGHVRLGLYTASANTA
jgi:hypothetical protein